MAVYLITGFTGTLGTALTKRLLAEGHKVRGVARNEHKIEALVAATEPSHRVNLSAFIGDVRDRYRLWRALQGVEYVIHAAALKVVGRCEYDPEEAIKTNIDGTMALVQAALDCGVRRAVFISSDKACLPVNLYGMTKAVTERAWLAANRYGGGKGTQFVAVRYGNIAASNGSVVPIWRAQVEKKQPIVVTDPQCTRFHFRLADALEFVLQSLHESTPGELRVPMLPSYRLADLAEAVAPGHPTKIIGLQVGEKRHELMISSHESIYAKHRGNYYSLTPGTIQDGKEFEYSSGANTWRLGVEALKEEFPCLTPRS